MLTAILQTVGKSQWLPSCTINHKNLLMRKSHINGCHDFKDLQRSKVADFVNILVDIVDFTRNKMILWRIWTEENAVHYETHSHWSESKTWNINFNGNTWVNNALFLSLALYIVPTVFLQILQMVRFLGVRTSAVTHSGNWPLLH